MLSFEHVSKFIFSDFSLHIPRGVAVGLIGSSGAGKTTLLRLACGMLAPETGEVYTLQKNPVEKRSVLRPRIGCLLERMPVLEEEESVRDNLKKLQIIYRMSDKEFETEYTVLADAFELSAFEHSTVQGLSLGQRRRAELVAVLLHRPELLLLDEPTNGLDETAKEALQEVLQERIKQGMTLVTASHNMREVSGICNRIVLLEQGKLLYYGEEGALLRKYAPMDHMRLKVTGKLPDIDDLPVEKYVMEDEELVLTYNSNHITASEILEVLLKQCSVREVSIQKPDLADVIFAMRDRQMNPLSAKLKEDCK